MLQLTFVNVFAAVLVAFKYVDASMTIQILASVDGNDDCTGNKTQSLIQNVIILTKTHINLYDGKCVNVTYRMKHFCSEDKRPDNAKKIKVLQFITSKVR